MIIQCPACGQRAKLPDSKEGAKVRCSECSRVYVARQPGAKRTSGGDPTKYFIIGGVVLVVGLLGLWIANQDSPEYAPPVEEQEEPEEPVAKVDTGWNSKLVQRAAEIHGLVHAQEAARLATVLDAEYAYAARNQAAEGEALQPGPLAEGTEPWFGLGELEQQQFRDALVEELVNGEGYALVGPWRPWDGWIVEEAGRFASVRVRVAPREDATAADRHVEWHLVRSGSTWKAYSWKRWISPDEDDGGRSPRRKKTVKRELSDGSVVIESAIRDLGHLEDTPAELRQEIDALLTDLVDIDARPKVRTAAHDRLREIGRPAIPPLLSMIARIPLETDEQAMQLQQVHMLLLDMTDYVTTYTPHVAMGGTEERQDSGLKQWFGWYDRKFKRYQGPDAGSADEVDPLLEGFEARNAQEAREIRRAIEEAQGGGR